MSALSTPIPNAFVAAITFVSPRTKRSWTAVRSSSRIPAWYPDASMPQARRAATTFSTFLRVAA